jgi:hypothetical protein
LAYFSVLGILSSGLKLFMPHPPAPVSLVQVYIPR